MTTLDQGDPIYEEDLALYSKEDVLLGKGYHWAQYENARGRQKSVVAKVLILNMQANGVRFWKKNDEESWTDTSLRS